MADITHTATRFATDLGRKLATHSRHVCALLGAGVSRACNLPDVAGLQRAVADELDGDQKTHFVHLLERRNLNLEEVLTRLRRIATLLEGEQRIDELTADEAEALDRAICKAITRQLDLAHADLSPMRLFAAEIQAAP